MKRWSHHVTLLFLSDACDRVLNVVLVPLCLIDVFVVVLVHSLLLVLIFDVVERRLQSRPGTSSSSRSHLRCRRTSTLDLKATAYSGKSCLRFSLFFFSILQKARTSVLLYCFWILWELAATCLQVLFVDEGVAIHTLHPSHLSPPSARRCVSSCSGDAGPTHTVGLQHVCIVGEIHIHRPT